jgi:hypothetical protein
MAYHAPVRRVARRPRASGLLVALPHNRAMPMCSSVAVAERHPLVQQARSGEGGSAALPTTTGRGVSTVDSGYSHWARTHSGRIGQMDRPLPGACVPLSSRHQEAGRPCPASTEPLVDGQPAPNVGHVSPAGGDRKDGSFLGGWGEARKGRYLLPSRYLYGVARGFYPGGARG